MLTHVSEWQTAYIVHIKVMQNHFYENRNGLRELHVVTLEKIAPWCLNPQVAGKPSQVS